MKGLIFLMPTTDIITEDFVRSVAPNASAISNAQKISRTGGFVKLARSEDKTLIFGECKGSGKNPYYSSADFSGDSPVFRCSCPSRQFPCKHCLAIMFDWLAGKDFKIEEVPEDIARKRSKLEAKNNPQEDTPEKAEKKKKSALSTAKKKLKKQLEGLELAENFVKDILGRGVSSINSTSATQYNSLAKQLGDYYLPEPQAIMYKIISSAQKLSTNPDDNQINEIVSLCIRLSSTIKKSREYINSKLESGEVLPENNILYEAMGGVWKLTQLKEIGLYKENASIIQLSFAVLFDEIHKAEIDFAYWIDIDTGEIFKTKNIRPLRAMGYIKEENSSFGVHKIKELYRYPANINNRIRWESAEISEPTPDTYKAILSKTEKSIGDAVKKAKNELKNTLSGNTVAVLLPFDSVEYSVSDKKSILRYGSESIELAPDENYPDTCNVVSVLKSEFLRNASMLGELFYNPDTRKFYLCPLSVVTENNIIRLC
ncbi:MAG: SWIM zinc finger family protein [Oscillospiraceae bacterium]|nr:SWIM zinc finger family protein [Oscillospiraceae bacterium]